MSDRSAPAEYRVDESPFIIFGEAQGLRWNWVNDSPEIGYWTNVTMFGGVRLALDVGKLQHTYTNGPGVGYYNLVYALNRSR